MNIDKSLIRADIVADGSKNYNDFKDVQDRKWYLASVFEGFYAGGSNFGKPLKVTQYVGSDQVIIKFKDKQIYDSMRDTFTPKSFVEWMTNLYVKMIEFRKDKSAYSKYVR